MIGLLTALSTLLAAFSDESKNTSCYTPAELACLAALRESGYDFVESNDLQILQASLGNGVVCPLGHAGPFQAFRLVLQFGGEYKVVSGDEVSVDLHETCTVPCPLLFECHHPDHRHNDADTRIFVVKPLERYIDFTLR